MNPFQAVGQAVAGVAKGHANAIQNMFGVDVTPGFNVQKTGNVVANQQGFYTPTTVNMGGRAAPSVQSTQVNYGPGTASGGGNGGGGVQNVATQYVDPTYTDSTGRTWANANAFQNNVNNVRRNVNVKQGGYETEGRSSNAGNRLAYGNDSQDLITGQRTGQNTINSGRVNNALNLRRSMAGIASGVRQGIRSGAVNLANMNAMDSGASEAMSRAFARQGNTQAGQANNEAQLVENQLGTEQQNLLTQRDQGMGRLKGWRENKVREVSDKLWQNLQELDASAQGEGVAGAVDMGIRDRVIADANNELNAIDAATQAELSKITALDYGQVQEQASQMDAAGALASNPFAVESGTVQFGQPTRSTLPGAPLGPLAVTPRGRDETNPFMPPSMARSIDENNRV